MRMRIPILGIHLPDERAVIHGWVTSENESSWLAFFACISFLVVKDEVELWPIIDVYVSFGGIIQYTSHGVVVSFNFYHDWKNKATWSRFVGYFSGLDSRHSTTQNQEKEQVEERVELLVSIELKNLSNLGFWDTLGLYNVLRQGKESIAGTNVAIQLKVFEIMGIH